MVAPSPFTSRASATFINLRNRSSLNGSDTVLLIAATVIDLQYYIIPDEITLPGTLIGLTLAIAFGNLQFVPVWIDFNHPMTAVYGPYIPEWVKQNHHLHGLAFSMAGIVAGAGLTWLVRILSEWILQQERS